LEGRGPPAWKFWSNWSRKKRIWVGCLLAVILLLAIIIPVALVVSKKKGSDSKPSSSDSDDSSPTSNLDSISRDSIPVSVECTGLMEFADNSPSELCQGHRLGSVYVVRDQRV
jgi:glucan 1,3-beta-glucosidase